ncbi:MAG: ABC transporter permease [Saprospiraceae bacterium]|nr:ABC transporter permease [Saprospiraceae bacterium]
MLISQLKIAFRNLTRNRIYTIINILGLAVGIAAMVWAFQNYRIATTWDNFHEKRNEIYRGLIVKEGVADLQGVFPIPAATLALNEFEGVDDMVRLMYRNITLRAAGRQPFNDEVLFTDPSFTGMFTFRTHNGTQRLDEPGQAIISKSAAIKYFGQEEPVGQTLILYSGSDHEVAVEVTGVLEEQPSNSTIHYEIITRLDNYFFEDGSPLHLDDWKVFAHAVFFSIPDPGKVSKIENAFDKYLEAQHKARRDWPVEHFILKQLPESARLSLIDNNALRSCPEDSAILGPLMLAILLLLGSCLNFANTTIAESGRRLREIGVRKVLGSSNTAVRTYFLLESGLIVFVALLLSVVFNQWWFPTYSRMFFFVDLQADYFHDLPLLGFMVFLWVFVTIFAGFYPALYLSRFNATSIFKGTVKYGGTNLFSRILLGLQVSIALITVIAGMAFTVNAHFQRDYDYGYEKNNVVVLPIYDSHNTDVVRNSILHLEAVASVTAMQDHIGYSYRQKTVEAEGRKLESNYLAVGPDYLECMQIDLLEGRNFYRDSWADVNHSAIITRNFVMAQGWSIESCLNKNIRIDSLNFKVIGVVSDFHQSTLFNEMEPTMIVQADSDDLQQLAIRAEPGMVTVLFNGLKDKWEELFPFKPFRGFYQNEIGVESYQVTVNIASIFLWFSLVSLLLSTAGLYGLLSLTLLKKMRELAIRKVVGAGKFQLTRVISRGYIWIILIAVLLGAMAGYQLTKLLLDLIFKINIGVPFGVLAFSSVGVVMISAATAFMKLRAALRMQPAEVLKGD